jgi:hypothetical protein
VHEVQVLLGDWQLTDVLSGGGGVFFRPTMKSCFQGSPTVNSFQAVGPPGGSLAIPPAPEVCEMFENASALPASRSHFQKTFRGPGIHATIPLQRFESLPCRTWKAIIALVT